MSKTPVLHELLAVEADAEGVAKRVTDETKHTFKERQTHFQGAHRTLKLFNQVNGDEAATAAAEKVEEQHLEMVTTVHAKLEYALSQILPFYDVVLRKEATNQDAFADLIVGDVTIAEKLPATFLLGLEKKLKMLREVYEQIPTLAPGIKWELDSTIGKNVYRMSAPEVRAKTTKTFKHQILVAPTDKHPAQIEKWEETVNIGAYTKETWSSAMTVTEKSALLGRIDDLIVAAKQARQRANMAAVRKVNVSEALIKFIHPNGF